MANNPTKVKDPTEVALSAIQEALNINDAPTTETERGGHATQAAPAASVFHETSFDLRPVSERPAFDRPDFDVSDDTPPPLPPRRPANDDRDTIGQIPQAIQKGRPARNFYRLATFFAAAWIAGCAALTIGFLTPIQAAIGQGGGGVLVLAGPPALFFAPVLLFYVMASIAWRGQELGTIAQAMAQVAIRFSEPDGTTADSMVTVGQASRREVAAMG